MIRYVSSISSCYRFLSLLAHSQLTASIPTSARLLFLLYSNSIQTYVLHDFQLFWSCVQSSQHLGVLKVFLVVFHEHFASLFVESTFGEGYNEEAFDDFKDVGEGPVGWIPIFFEGINTNFSFF